MYFFPFNPMFYNPLVIPYMYRQSDLNKSVSIVESKVKPEEFELKYPLIQDLSVSKTVQNKVNEHIIDCQNELFKSQVLSNIPQNFIDITGFYEMGLNKNGILSILFGLYTFTGGAHGFNEYSSITVDTDTGDKYEFKDLFTSKINYVPILEEEIKRYLKINEVPLVLPYKGLEDEPSFYLTEKELVIYYQVYEYTPYYYGLLKIKIPYKNILNLLGPKSPIQNILN